MQEAGPIAAITKLPVQNLRFEVVTPSVNSASRLVVQSMYFELHTGTRPPAYLSNSLEPKDIMSWQIPFENAGFTQGQFSMSHDVGKGIRVKIAWPFYQNRVMIAHFDSTLNVSYQLDVLLCPRFAG